MTHRPIFERDNGTVNFTQETADMAERLITLAEQDSLISHWIAKHQQEDRTILSLLLIACTVLA